MAIVVILLMAIDGIGGYSIVNYWWLLMVIVLMIINDCCIINYC